MSDLRSVRLTRRQRELLREAASRWLADEHELSPADVRTLDSALMKLTDLDEGGQP